MWKLKPFNYIIIYNYNIWVFGKNKSIIVHWACIFQRIFEVAITTLWSFYSSEVVTMNDLLDNCGVTLQSGNEIGEKDFTAFVVGITR